MRAFGFMFMDADNKSEVLWLINDIYTNTIQKKGRNGIGKSIEITVGPLTFEIVQN
jgi:hypothetical protein